jgi:nucleoside-diphosphate-sugar epimerase
MKIALLGATSQIARGLIKEISSDKSIELFLFGRRPEQITNWLNNVALLDAKFVGSFDTFNTKKFDAIINFIGIGSPLKILKEGAAIFDITHEYDQLCINYLKQNPKCRYIFLSSGSVYFSSFDAPVDEKTKAIIEINNLKHNNWYALSKLHAECRHRALSSLSIVDIRLFNYFSRSQDINARFFISDMIRSIQNNKIFETSSDLMVRDYIAPKDFCSLVDAILKSSATNDVIDSYSKAPIEKSILLDHMSHELGLKYEFVDNPSVVDATGQKPHYYSLNRRASQFGYEPSLTSIESILSETKYLLDSLGNLKKP